MSSPTDNRPKFAEFVAKTNDGKLWFTAQTIIPAGTRIAVFAKPPSPTTPQLRRVQMKFIGTVHFPTRLEINDQTDKFTAVYRTAFGLASTNRPQGNWFMLWQVEGGYLRTLDDECVAPNSDVPRQLTLTWRNDHLTLRSYLRTGEIKSSNGNSIPTPGAGPTTGTVFLDVVRWEQFVEPGPASRWNASWFADDDPGGSFSVPIAYPFTNVITGP